MYTFGWEGDEALPPGTSTVTVTLEPAEGGTTVRLVHEGLTPEQDENHSHGWDHFLGRLVAAGHEGDAGPDPSLRPRRGGVGPAQRRRGLAGPVHPRAAGDGAR